MQTKERSMIGKVKAAPSNNISSITVGRKYAAVTMHSDISVFESIVSKGGVPFIIS